MGKVPAVMHDGALVTEQVAVFLYLADFRSPDPAQDFIRQEWTWLDLTPLSAATRSLHFTLSSSDNGAFGMNTPAM